MARELGVDISKAVGSGPSGEITKLDLEKLALPPTNPLEGTIVRLSGIPLAMAKAMTESMSIPNVTVGQNVDFTDLVLKAKEITARVNKMKITVTPLLIKIFSLAMEKYPIFNSKFGPNNQYTLFKNHNISVAIATDHGLVVPNIKAVQNRNIMSIAEEMNRLQKLAMERLLPIKDITQGTFTISNLGSIGCSMVSPRLFDGQAAIAGITAAELVPRFIKGELKERRVAQIGLTADHRHIDGAAMALFLKEVRSIIESPDRLDLFL